MMHVGAVHKSKSEKTHYYQKQKLQFKCLFPFSAASESETKLCLRNESNQQTNANPFEQNTSHLKSAETDSNFTVGRYTVWSADADSAQHVKARGAARATGARYYQWFLCSNFVEIVAIIFPK